MFRVCFRVGVRAHVRVSVRVWMRVRVRVSVWVRVRVRVRVGVRAHLSEFSSHWQFHEGGAAVAIALIAGVASLPPEVLSCATLARGLELRLGGGSFWLGFRVQAQGSGFRVTPTKNTFWLH
jgi:hypothetical protein